MLRQVDTFFYHGTAEKIEKVDVSKGRSSKDFGKGFYMAVSKNQAIGMMHKKFRETVARRPKSDKSNLAETLYEITIDFEYAKTLTIKEF